jgi:hypothetical protein
MEKLDNRSAALNLLNEFMVAMNTWEIDFFQARKESLKKGEDDPGLKVAYGEELKRILDHFAIEDKANFGRLIDLGCTNPPTYDVGSDVLEIISSESQEVIVGVEQTVGAEVSSRITLVFKKGDWKIKKKESLGYDEKWKRSPL